eukprot:3742010-Rhodomonas_salina.2
MRCVRVRLPSRTLADAFPNSVGSQPTTGPRSTSVGRINVRLLSRFELSTDAIASLVPRHTRRVLHCGTSPLDAMSVLNTSDNMRAVLTLPPLAYKDTLRWPLRFP